MTQRFALDAYDRHRLVGTEEFSALADAITAASLRLLAATAPNKTIFAAYAGNASRAEAIAASKAKASGCTAATFRPFKDCQSLQWRWICGGVIAAIGSP